MRKVIVNDWLTLDGVIQSPSGPDEDPTGGFAHGGWHARHAGDAVFMRWVEDGVGGAGGYLFGRRTWETFAAYWPTAPAAVQVLAEPLNTRPKYVASGTLAEPLAWQNSFLLAAGVPAAVTALKNEPGGDLLAIGSTELVRTLMRHDLVDEFRLMIDPVLVGGGKRLFPDDGVLRPLRLVHCRSTPAGAILATWTPENRS